MGGFLGGGLSSEEFNAVEGVSRGGKESDSGGELHVGIGCRFVLFRFEL